MAGLALSDIDHVERQLAGAVERARATALPATAAEEIPPESRLALAQAAHPDHDPWVCLGRAREELRDLGAVVDARPAGSYDGDEAHRLAVAEWRRVEILLTDGGGST